MRRRTAVLLAVLLVLGIGAGIYAAFARLLPAPVRAGFAGLLSHDPNKISMPPGIASESRVLLDGSFNYNPTKKHPPDFPPDALAYDKDWRARYGAILGRNPRTGPTVYVHNFLDRTPAGMGIHVTFGSRYLFMAAIAQWTDARVVGAHTPRALGFALVDPQRPNANIDYTLQDCIRDVLADPASEKAEWLIFGHYSWRPRDTYDFAIYAVERAHPELENARKLYQADWQGMGNFPQLASRQRDAVQPTIQALIESGIVKARDIPRPVEIELAAELGEIADMFDLNDSRLMMEGIDRSLALAALFPRETLPLQAAGYGLFILAQSMLVYCYPLAMAEEYFLRQWGLAQLAVVMAPNVSLSHINWLSSQRFFDQPTVNWSNDIIVGTDLTTNEPALEAYRLISRYSLSSDLRLVQNSAPDTLMLGYENAARNIVNGNRDLAPYFKARMDLWPEHDMFLQVFYQSCTGRSYNNYRPASAAELYDMASATAARACMAAEVATLLPELDKAAQVRLTLGISQASGQGESFWAKMAGKDYYAIRRAALEGFADWTAPLEAANPYFKALAACHQAARSILADPAKSKPLSPYVGFEFTPAERVQFWQGLDCMGSVIEGFAQSNIHDSTKTIQKVMTLYLDIRPDNYSARSIYVLFLHLKKADTGIPEKLREQALLCYAQHPRQKTAFRIGESYMEDGDGVNGHLYLNESKRLDPYCPPNYGDMAYIYAQNGYYQMAEKMYRAYLGFPIPDYTQQMQMRLEVAWCLCQTGRASEPEARLAFEDAVTKFPGFNGYIADMVTYQIEWMKDYDAARRVIASTTGNFKAWQNARIERAAGNKEKAVEWLQKVDYSNVTDVSVYRGDVFFLIGCGRPDLAERLIQAAPWGADSHDILIAKAELALSRKQWQQALDYCVRDLELYGNSAFVFIRLSKAHNGLGHPEDAIKILENLLTPPNAAWESQCAPLLIDLYVQTGQIDRARETLDWFIQSPGRKYGSVAEACDVLGKVDPEKAGEIRSRIGEIMAGDVLKRESPFRSIRAAEATGPAGN